MIRWDTTVHADAFNVREAAMDKFSAQVGMSFGICSVANVFAEWVACRDEGAAIDAVAFVQGGEGRADFAYFHGEWLVAVRLVFGLAIALLQARADD